MLFNLDSANKPILSCFYFFFLIIDLYLLILAIIAQILNPIAELVMSTRILTKEAKAEIETHSGTRNICYCKQYKYPTMILKYMIC